MRVSNAAAGFGSRPARGRNRFGRTVDRGDDATRIDIERAVTDDGYRRRGVVQALLTDRAEQQPAKSAQAACADHEEVGVASGFDERRTWEVRDDLEVEAFERIGTERHLDVTPECRMRLGLAVLGIPSRRIEEVVLLEPAPRHDRGQRGAVEIGFLFGPAQRVGCAVRFVDADNDATPRGSRAHDVVLLGWGGQRPLIGQPVSRS